MSATTGRSLRNEISHKLIRAVMTHIPASTNRRSSGGLRIRATTAQFSTLSVRQLRNRNATNRALHQLEGNETQEPDVQPEVAKFSQVCSYDRAGCGWSDSVLTATRQDDIAPEIPRNDAKAEEELWVHQLQPELARLSTHGKQIIVDSSHEMPTEHPEIVISAIHEVWLAARVCCCRVHYGLSGN